MTTGTTTIAVQAIDASGNVANASYEVDQTASSSAHTFDANGNVPSDGVRSFEWDARNQLVAITAGTHRTEFAYDGLQQRVRRIEKENGVTQSDTRLLWCRGMVCEERAANGTTVLRRLFQRGEQMPSLAGPIVRVRIRPTA